MSLSVLATQLEMPVHRLKWAVDQLGGRGRCDQLAATETARRREPIRRQLVLQTMVCPPFVARRAGWDESRFVRGNARGVAGWASRGVSSLAAPRVAHTKAATASASRPIAARQRGCPPAIAVRLVADDRPTGQYLAASTPHPAVVAALAIAGDKVASAVAAERDDRPAPLAGVAPLRVGPGRCDPANSRGSAELGHSRTVG